MKEAISWFLSMANMCLIITLMVWLYGPNNSQVGVVDLDNYGFNETSMTCRKGEVTHITGVKGIALGYYDSKKGHLIVRRFGDSIVHEFWYDCELEPLPKVSILHIGNEK